MHSVLVLLSLLLQVYIFSYIVSALLVKQHKTKLKQHFPLERIVKTY
jgi:hypothetical protein